MGDSKNTPLEMRECFGRTLVELGEQYPNIVVLDADLNTSSKTVIFKKRFPDRFIQCGIAEQNMFGIAAGLATQGYIPFPSTFAVFATKRALDQISISISYPRLNVKIPGSYAGVPTSRAGGSHNAVEDLANMRAMPNMRVIDPGDNNELRSCMYAMCAYHGPVYFRITRWTLPDILPADYAFAWGRGVRLLEGGDVTLIGTGFLTSFCLEAADLLRADGVHAEVLHMGCIKPIDAELIAESAAKTGAVVTAENASTIGGLGSAVAEVTAERAPAVLRRIGVHDRFIDSGGIRELLEYHGMTPAHIAAAARDAIAARDHRRATG